MNITFFSDTHLIFNKIDLPGGDLLIHSGDLTMNGTEANVRKALEYLKSIPNYRYKVFIAGNHDFLFEIRPNKIKEILKDFPDLIYLENSSIEIEGLKIWGSPITPWFHNWAFNRQRGEEIKKYWDEIPNDLDILITHGPPFGVLDLTLRGHQRTGCEELIKVIGEKLPKIHVFGHIHEEYGYVEKTFYDENGEEKGKVLFINASVLTLHYEPLNYPFEIEYDMTSKTIVSLKDVKFLS